MYKCLTLLAEGRQPVTFGGWSRVRRPRVWLVSTHSGRARLPLAGDNYLKLNDNFYYWREHGRVSEVPWVRCGSNSGRPLKALTGAPRSLAAPWP
jgi:hypothetical protein